MTAAIAGTVKRAGIDGKILGDIVVGNVQTEGAYAGPARMAQFRAGIPYDVPLVTINRQCSSGLQAVANIASGLVSSTVASALVLKAWRMVVHQALAPCPLPTSLRSSKTIWRSSV